MVNGIIVLVNSKPKHIAVHVKVLFYFGKILSYSRTMTQISVIYFLGINIILYTQPLLSVSNTHYFSYVNSACFSQRMSLVNRGILC